MPRRKYIEKLPTVLILGMDRSQYIFRNGGVSIVKVKTHVNFPFTLDMDRFVSDPYKLNAGLFSTRYDLKAVVVRVFIVIAISNWYFN